MEMKFVGSGLILHCNLPFVPVKIPRGPRVSWLVGIPWARLHKPSDTHPQLRKVKINPWTSIFHGPTRHTSLPAAIYSILEQ